jgi:hypothetical protein
MNHVNAIITVQGACGCTWQSDHNAIRAGTWQDCPICDAPICPESAEIRNKTNQEKDGAEGAHLEHGD